MTPLARNWFFGAAVHGLQHARRSPSMRVTCSIAESTPQQFWPAMLHRGAHLVSDDVAGPPRRTGDAEGQTVNDATVLGDRGRSSRRRCSQRGASAHVGSPDVFLDGQAGPYRLFVTVRPPLRGAGRRRRRSPDDLAATSATCGSCRCRSPGPGAQFAPAPDVAMRSPDDPRLFTGHLWMMTAGAWQVRVAVSGDRGQGTLSVPVPTLPQATLAMTRALRALLFGFMLLLCGGFVAIVSAIAREARLEPGEAPGPRARRRGRIAGLDRHVRRRAASMSSATGGGRPKRRATRATSTSRCKRRRRVTPDGRLRLDLRDPGWIREPPPGRLRRRSRPPDAPVHRVARARPSVASASRRSRDRRVRARLPDMPQGQYELFADLVHRTGVSETVTGQLDTPAIRGVAADRRRQRVERRRAPARAGTTSAGPLTGDASSGCAMVSHSGRSS